MQPHQLFNLLSQIKRTTHRLPLMVRAGGRIIEVEGIGLETLPGGRTVLTLTPAEHLRVLEASLEKVTDIGTGRR